MHALNYPKHNDKYTIYIKNLQINYAHKVDKNDEYVSNIVRINDSIRPKNRT